MFANTFFAIAYSSLDLQHREVRIALGAGRYRLCRPEPSFESKRFVDRRTAIELG
jgi:hypothetical protein